MKPRLSNMAAFAFTLLFLAGSATMSNAALNSYAQLTLNGEALTGDVTLHSMGGVNVSSEHLECYAINHEIYAAGNGAATHAPFKIVKRVDKASPLLYKALAQNQAVAGTIKYFRTSAEDGTTELYFTMTLTGARVSAIRHWSPNNLDSAGSPYPHMEEISLTYQSLTITEVKANVSAEIEAAPR